MDGVSVSPQAVVQGLHNLYGRQIGQLAQQCAELAAANEALAAERDQLRDALVELKKEEPVAINMATEKHVPRGFQGDPRWPAEDEERAGQFGPS